MTDLPPIERAIAVQPGDILIATLPAGTAPDELERVRAALVDELDGIHVVVTVGIDFQAYRRQDDKSQRSADDIVASVARKMGLER